MNSHCGTGAFCARESPAPPIAPSTAHPCGHISCETSSTSRRRSSGPASKTRRSPIAGARSAPEPPVSFGKSNAKSDKDIPVLAAGDKVTHDQFGVGTVLQVEGMGAKAVAKIDFGGDGPKRLLLRFAPVTKL